MNKWKAKRTIGPNNIEWRKWRKYEELDGEKGTVEVNGGSTRKHSLGWRRSCVVERRVRRYTEKQKPRMVAEEVAKAVG